MPSIKQHPPHPTQRTCLNDFARMCALQMLQFSRPDAFEKDAAAVTPAPAVLRVASPASSALNAQLQRVEERLVVQTGGSEEIPPATPRNRHRRCHFCWLDSGQFVGVSPKNNGKTVNDSLIIVSGSSCCKLQFLKPREVLRVLAGNIPFGHKVVGPGLKTMRSKRCRKWW